MREKTLMAIYYHLPTWLKSITVSGIRELDKIKFSKHVEEGYEELSHA
jgi:hypothetical protein